MGTRLSKAYLLTKVLTASNQEVIVYLYEGAISYLHRSVVALRENQRAIAGAALERCISIVVELSGSLNYSVNSHLALKLDARGNVAADDNYMTSMDRVFAAGDLRRGQSLVVWALAEGREAARGIDVFLMGHSDLPTLETRIESLPRR